MSLVDVLPGELIELIFCHIAAAPIDPATGIAQNHLSTVQFAKTCKLCYEVFSDNRAIWTALFAAKFDLHPRHLDAKYDIQREYKHRVKTLVHISSWIQHGRQFAPHHAHVDCLRVLAFEHKERNFTVLRKSPGVPPLLRRELRALLKMLGTGEREPEVLERMPLADIRNWLAIFAVLIMSTDRQFAEYLVSSFSLRNDDPIGQAFDGVLWNARTHLHTIEGAQRAHLVILRILCYIPADLIKPFPRLGASWVDLLGKDKKGVDLRPANPPQESTLQGRWTGWYSLSQSYRNKDATSFSFPLVVQPRSDPNSPYAISSENGVGQDFTFRLSGHIHPNGSVNFLMVKNSEEEWYFRGYLLPWGIAGSFEDGLFWTWKERD